MNPSRIRIDKGIHMSKMMKNSLAMIALVLATTAAVAQVPVLKKPVMAPQIKPVVPPVVLKRPITVVDAPGPVANNPTREETARRLRAQNLSAAASLTAIRAAFAKSVREEIPALRAAGYSAAELAVAFKDADQLSPSRLLFLMPFMGFDEGELAPQLRSLYALEFDALLAALRQLQSHGSRGEFGYALDAMDYPVEQMVQTGYRYFAGGFPDPLIGGGTPYPNAKQLYNLLMMENPLRENVRISHYSLFQMLMASGYSPEQVISEVPMGRYTPVVNTPMDDISNCIARTHSNAGGTARGRVEERINPLMVIQMAPDGTATYADDRRTCVAKFLDLLRANGTSRDVASVLIDHTVKCAPATNPACPAQRALETERILKEAGYAP